MPSNLYQRGGIWWGRVQVNGQDIRRSLRTRDRAEAKRKLKAMMLDAEQIRFAGGTRPSYEEAVIRWAEEHLPHQVKPSVAKRYRVSARQLHPHFIALHIDQINRRKVADYVTARRKKGATNATIRRDLTALSSILQCCVAWGWSETNPAKDYDRSLIRERRDPIAPPSQDDVDLLVAALPGSLSRLVRLLHQTGMRLEEAASLEWWQVDQHRGEITLARTKTDCPRALPLTDPLMAPAAGTIAGTVRHLKSPLVFWHGDGKRYRRASNQISQTIKRLTSDRTPEDARISRRFRCHDLRHGFAIGYLQRGGGVYDLQRILGHASVQTTERYVSWLAARPAQRSAHVQRSVTGCIED